MSERFASQSENRVEGNEEERLKAAKILNLSESLSMDEIGEAYFRFELAQKGASKMDLSKEERAARKKELDDSKTEFMEQWKDQSFREAKYAGLEWVGEKIRKAGEINKNAVGSLGTPEKREDVLKTIADKWFVKSGLKEIITHKNPDLDAKIAVELLRMAGVNFDGVYLIKKGEYEPGKNPNATGSYFDVGSKENITIENGGERVFIDNHSEFFNQTSAVKLTYETLVEISKLEEYKDESWFKKLNSFLKENKVWLEKMVSFVNEWDNLSYATSEEFFRKDFANTLYGIQRDLPVEVIFKLFQDPDFDPRKPFSEADKKIGFVTKEVIQRARQEKIDKKTGKVSRPAQDLITEEKTVTIGDLTKEAQEKVTESIEGIENAYTIPNHPIFGKLLVNVVDKIGEENGEIITDNKIILGPHAVKSMGYDTYLTFNRSTSSFFLNSFKKDLNDILPQIEETFPRAIISRGRMILHNFPRKDITENRLDLRPYGLEKLLDALKIQLEAKKQSSEPEKPATPEEIRGAVDMLKLVFGDGKTKRAGTGNMSEDFRKAVLEELSKEGYICKPSVASAGERELYIDYEKFVKIDKALAEPAVTNVESSGVKEAIKLIKGIGDLKTGRIIERNALLSKFALLIGVPPAEVYRKRPSKIINAIQAKLIKEYGPGKSLSEMIKLKIAEGENIKAPALSPEEIDEIRKHLSSGLVDDEARINELLKLRTSEEKEEILRRSKEDFDDRKAILARSKGDFNDEKQRKEELKFEKYRGFPTQEDEERLSRYVSGLQWDQYGREDAQTERTGEAMGSRSPETRIERKIVFEMLDDLINKAITASNGKRNGSVVVPRNLEAETEYILGKRGISLVVPKIGRRPGILKHGGSEAVEINFKTRGFGGNLENGKNEE